MISRQLIVEITDRTHEKLLGEEFRCAPVEMPIDAVLVVGGRVGQIICQARDEGELLAFHRIEIGIARATIDCPVTYPNIGETS